MLSLFRNIQGRPGQTSAFITQKTHALLAAGRSTPRRSMNLGGGIVHGELRVATTRRRFLEEIKGVHQIGEALRAARMLRPSGAAVLRRVLAGEGRFEKKSRSRDGSANPEVIVSIASTGSGKTTTAARLALDAKQDGRVDASWLRRA